MQSQRRRGVTSLKVWSPALAAVVAFSFLGMSTSSAATSNTKYSGPTAHVTPPKTLKLAVITCANVLSGCLSPAVGVQKVGKTLGWNVRIFDGANSPTTQNTQILNALAGGAKFILTTAIDPNAVQTGLRAAKKAGVPVGSGSDGLNSPNPTIKPKGSNLGYVFDVAPNYAALGKLTAQWIISDSHRKANIVVYSDKEFPSVLAFQKGLLAGLKACTTCKVGALQYFVGAQVGSVLPQSVVSYLRSNSNVNYVFLPYDPAAGTVVPAIASAGLGSRVRLVSVLGSAQNVAFVRAGHIEVAD